MLDNGDLTVYGLTEGRIAPTDGTNAFPLVLRLRPTGAIAAKAVYRDIGFGRVAGAAPLQDGLAVLTVTRNPDDTGRGPSLLTLYRTSRDGARQGVLFAQPNASAPEDALLRTADGGFVVLTFPFDANAANVIKLDAEGTVQWTYRMPEVQDVRAADLASNGDIFLLGAVSSGQFTVARLAPNGTERWQRTYGSTSEIGQVGGFTALDDGVAVLETRIGAGTNALRLTRLREDGAVDWRRPYAEGRVRATALATRTGDDLVFTWTEDTTEDIGGERAEIAYLNPDGSVQARAPFGPQSDASTFASALLPYRDGSLIAVGATGPEHLGGFGGDDFDVLVEQFAQTAP